MKLTSTLVLLLPLILASFSASLAAEEIPEKNGFSFDVSGDIHGGIAYIDNNTEDTYYPVQLRLQAELNYDDNLSLTGRINTVKAIDLEQSDDDNFMVDRLFFSWRNILLDHLALSFGRLPTMGNNSPAQIRVGLDRPESDLLAFTDIIMDGASLGYELRQENWIEQLTFYGASQYDYGYEGGDEVSLLEDSDIYGINLTARNKKYSTFIFQAVAIKDIYNLPEDIVFVNPLEFVIWENDNTMYNPLDPSMNLILDRANLGNIYHTAIAFQAGNNDLSYFLALGWSRTDGKNFDEMGTGLLTSWWDEPEEKDGYSFYTGLRYDFKDSRIKLGLEFNYGTENWIAFTAPDQFEISKLATRGYAGEVFTIYELPSDAQGINLEKAFVRLGCQYLHYEYTGSGYWLGKPQDIDELKNDPLYAQFYVPVDHEQRLYLTADLYF